VVVLLGIVALDLATVMVAGAAITASVLRWGSSSLPAIAGAQAVLGPAVLVAPAAAALSAAATALALVCVAPPGPLAAPFGIAAAVLAAGPAASTPSRLAVRVAAAAAGALLALVISRRVPRPRRFQVAAGAAIVACAAALAS
jgi:hypothetical protein